MLNYQENINDVTKTTRIKFVVLRGLAMIKKNRILSDEERSFMSKGEYRH